VIEHKGKDGRMYRYLRFTAYGKRRHIPVGAISAEAAERKLTQTIADVQRGQWLPPEPVQAPPEPELALLFHAFAEETWTRIEGQLEENTRDDYRWRLEVHLIPYFGEMPLNVIDFDAIERYIAYKLAENKRITQAIEDGEPLIEEYTDRIGRKCKRTIEPLSPRSINMTLTLLSAFLERAAKRKLIDGNAARDKDLRVKEKAPTRSYLDSAGQIATLLDAAGRLDAKAASNRRHVERRAMLAVLVFAGLRINELCALRWRDVDLAGGWISTGSKTDAGTRRVKIRGALRDELLNLRQRHQDAKQGAYVFPTATGGEQSPDNFRSRVLGKPATVKDAEEVAGKGTIGEANRQLEADGLAPLPAKLTPHSLRRTFCSLLYALGEDPGTVMDEMGHTDPALALRVYRQAMRRSEDEKAALQALVEGGIVADSGRRAENEGAMSESRKAA
jgi:integrase